MQDTIEETVTGIEPGTLCDVDCVALAFVKVELINGSLYFCGHHYAEVEQVMTAAGYNIIDEREKLSNRMRYIDMWINTPAGRK